MTELSLEIRRALRPLTSVLVRGEVTGLKRTGRGNYSFAVRDQAAVVQAFLYGNDARRLGIVPEDGQVFVFRGRVELWQSGQLSLVVDFIQFDDVGRLRAQLEALKRRLELEGAFEPARKRPLPSQRQTTPARLPNHTTEPSIAAGPVGSESPGAPENTDDVPE